MNPIRDSELLEYMDFAETIGRQAGRHVMQLFHAGVHVELKDDESPVTRADRETEQFLRDAISARFPDHGILGEELGTQNPEARNRWIIDPIDGTQSFVHGVPLFTVLLALVRDGQPLVGMIHHPPSGQTLTAARGQGCYHDGRRCHVSQTAHLDQAWVHATDWADLQRRYSTFTSQILSTARYARGWGDAYGYMLVATGLADVMIDPVMCVWDLAALIPVIEEAGGRLTGFGGETGIHAPNAIASNGVLHPTLLSMAGHGPAETVHMHKPS